MKIERRVKSQEEFQEIMNKRQFRNNSSFSVYIVPKKEEKSRFGISAPKKLGNAVLRNKTKRQVRMMVQSFMDESLDYDYIILVRKNYFTRSYEDNRKDLEKLVKTVKISSERKLGDSNEKI